MSLRSDTHIQQNLCSLMQPRNVHRIEGVILNSCNVHEIKPQYLDIGSHGDPGRVVNIYKNNLYFSAATLHPLDIHSSFEIIYCPRQIPSIIITTEIEYLDCELCRVINIYKTDIYFSITT